MDFPFDYDIYEDGHYLATIEGIARVVANPDSGIHDDWSIDDVCVFGKAPGSSDWELITLKDTSVLYEPILLYLLGECRHDIDDAWAVEDLDDDGDLRRDQLLERELMQ